MRYCVWSEDGDGTWQTSCRRSFVLIEGTPEQNGMRFCCYCGSRLQQKLQEAA